MHWELIVCKYFVSFLSLEHWWYNGCSDVFLMIYKCQSSSNVVKSEVLSHWFCFALSCKHPLIQLLFCRIYNQHQYCVDLRQYHCVLDLAYVSVFQLTLQINFLLTLEQSHNLAPLLIVLFPHRQLLPTVDLVSELSHFIRDYSSEFILFSSPYSYVNLRKSWWRVTVAQSYIGRTMLSWFSSRILFGWKKNARSNATFYGP